MTEQLLIRTHAGQPPIAILGVPFDNLSAEELTELLGRMVESGRPHHLVTADMDFLVEAQSDATLRRIVFDANLVLCEGKTLIKASRWLGDANATGVMGAELLPLLLRVAVSRKLRVYLLGGPADSLGEAAQALQAAYPNLTLAGQHAPAREELGDDSSALQARITAARPDILLVALGRVRQEKWIAAQGRALGVPVVLGVGQMSALLAHGVGERARLPVLRALRDAWIFGRGILRQWWQLKFLKPRSSALVSTPVAADAECQCIKLPPRLDLQATRDDALLVDQVLADGRHCVLDLSGVDFIDSTGMGLLIRLQKKIHGSGRQLVLLAPSTNVQRALQLMQLQEYFATAANPAGAQELIQRRIAGEREGAAAISGHPESLRWPREITVSAAAKLWSVTEQYILGRTSQGRDGSIDLAGVAVLDNEGAALMVRARKLAQQHGCRLKFTGATAAVVQVLRRERLEEFLL